MTAIAKRTRKTEAVMVGSLWPILVGLAPLSVDNVDWSRFAIAMTFALVMFVMFFFAVSKKVYEPVIGHNEMVMRKKIAEIGGLDVRRSGVAEPILLRMRELEQNHGIFAGDERIKSRMRLVQKIIDSQKADNDIENSNANDIANAELNGFFVPQEIESKELDLSSPDPKDWKAVENKYPDDPGAVFNASVDAEQQAYLKELEFKKKAHARLKEIEAEFIAKIDDAEPIVAPTTIVQSDAHVARRNARIQAIQSGKMLPRHDPRGSLKPSADMEFERYDTIDGTGRVIHHVRLKDDAIKATWHNVESDYCNVCGEDDCDPGYHAIDVPSNYR